MTTDQAVKQYGSRAALARALGITPQAIEDWKAEPPPLRQIQLESMTSGKLRANPRVWGKSE